MPSPFGFETPRESAQRMYNSRAPTYENSWHPEYSRRFIALAPLKPGDRVLDLCCGTGLDAFLAAEIVGEEGEVVAIDVTEGMLAQLHERRTREPALGKRIRTIHHDVTDLEGLSGDGVKLESFDAILCSCAFVFFHDPSETVAKWKAYLKPGGVMVIDLPHEHNLRAGRVLESVAKEMDVKFPSNRLWIKSKESFGQILEAQGMRVEKSVLMENISGHGTKLIGIEEADSRYEAIINSSLTENVVFDDFKAKAKPLFRKEWERVAEDGKVEDVDCLYLYVARKAL